MWGKRGNRDLSTFPPDRCPTTTMMMAPERPSSFFFSFLFRLEIISQKKRKGKKRKSRWWPSMTITPKGREGEQSFFFCFMSVNVCRFRPHAERIIRIEKFHSTDAYGRSSFHVFLQFVVVRSRLYTRHYHHLTDKQLCRNVKDTIRSFFIG